MRGGNGYQWWLEVSLPDAPHQPTTPPVHPHRSGSEVTEGSAQDPYCRSGSCFVPRFFLLHESRHEDLDGSVSINIASCNFSLIRKKNIVILTLSSV
ncbi:hypothetical protein E2C01_044278 [Portunus trituberculatus]|uniref:Uncharacterized protein n=1 Tax=Portunus trituberculatus TaxID=210409 RepID=A0A5B7FRQ0_PORTR|nr:hypothetical protein [Portunus trituberculatus]